MNPPTREFARAARDGGIHAVAALELSYSQAMSTLGVNHGLADKQLKELKLAFAHAMSEIIDRMINPAIRAFLDLDPSQAVWSEAVLEQSRLIGLQAAITLETAATDPLVMRRT